MIATSEPTNCAIIAGTNVTVRPNCRMPRFLDAPNSNAEFLSSNDECGKFFPSQYDSRDSDDSARMDEIEEKASRARHHSLEAGTRIPDFFHVR
jgi:hypothetical protein